MNSPRLAISSRPKPYIMAHRGNQMACPENTLAAFRQAIADGADILETDLQLTADGVFVCIHDDTVDRTTNGNGAVAQMTLAEIKTLSAACGHPEFQIERIPALTELAALIPDHITLALELKTDRFLEDQVCRRLLNELDRTGVRDHTIVLSFSRDRLQAMQAVAADIPIGLITLSRLWPPSGVDLIGLLWPLLLINPFFVLSAHTRGQMVCPLDPTPDHRLWLYRWLKCDAVLTNNPGKTGRALRRAMADTPQAIR